MDETTIAIIGVSVPMVTALVTFGLHLNNRMVALEAKVNTLLELMRPHEPS